MPLKLSAQKEQDLQPASQSGANMLMIDHELGPAREELRQRSRAIDGLERVRLFHAHPRQRAPRGAELVFLPRELFFFREERSARRDPLIESVFGVRRPNTSHRARLRVEVSRLRAELAGLAEIAATATGFALLPRRGAEAFVLAPPIDGEDAALIALLSDGAAWSTSALSLALGASQRSVQRGLTALEEAGQVRAVGAARQQQAAEPAQILREYGPFPRVKEVHGVTFDGAHVWFASSDGLRSLDPETGKLARHLEVPCDAGTAFDGRHIYQIAGAAIHKPARHGPKARTCASRRDCAASRTPLACPFILPVPFGCAARLGC